MFHEGMVLVGDPNFDYFMIKSNRRERNALKTITKQHDLKRDTV